MTSFNTGIPLFTVISPITKLMKMTKAAHAARTLQHQCQRKLQWHIWVDLHLLSKDWLNTGFPVQRILPWHQRVSNTQISPVTRITLMMDEILSAMVWTSTFNSFSSLTSYSRNRDEWSRNCSRVTRGVGTLSGVIWLATSEAWWTALEPGVWIKVDGKRLLSP